MYGTTLEQFEARYRELGEGLIGSVRPLGNNGWHWLIDDTRCIYMRTPTIDAGFLTMLDEQDGGGMRGKQFYFKSATIIRVIEVALSVDELRMSGLGQYILDIHKFEEELNPNKQVTEQEQAEFWQALGAPLTV
jgi:hypothetical protein